jgi:hypothetical protein
MAPVALTALLALSSVSNIVTAYPLFGINLYERGVPKCTNVPPSKLATTFCVGTYPNVTDPAYLDEFKKHHPKPHYVPKCMKVPPEELATTFCVGPYPNITQRHDAITRRNPGDDQIVLPDWSEPVYRAWAGGNIT